MNLKHEQPEINITTSKNLPESPSQTHSQSIHTEKEIPVPVISVQTQEQNIEESTPGFLSVKAAKKDLLREKNLWQILRQSWRLEFTKSNLWGLSFAVILLALYASYSPSTTHEIADITRSWAEFGINVTLAVLGFLLAGFTIFATLSRPGLFVAMAQQVDQKTGLTMLKKSFFTFINVFMFYLGFVLLCLAVKLLAFSMGPLSLAIMASTNPESEQIVASVLARVGLVMVGSLFWFGTFLLNSFVFNVYHIVMAGIRWEMEDMDKNK